MKGKKATRIARRGDALVQVGALPYRHVDSGPVEFLLLTSRETKRFIIPKGWRMKGRSDAQAAAREAAEEAGVEGRVDPAPIGTYRYWKRLRRAFVPVRVIVFGLLVEVELEKWRERRQRSRQWLTREQAMALLDEPELVTLIAGFSPSEASDAAGGPQG
jgi:8-oxo-dGTP pyrophosphatase MutT (NUDIX family)